MKSIVMAGLLAAAAQLMAGDAVAQDTRSAIEKALGGTPKVLGGTLPKTRIFSAPAAERLLGETWRNGVLAILEGRLAAAGGGKRKPKNAAHTCLDIDDRGHVVSALTCRSSGDAEADRLAVTAATQRGDFPPPPGDRTSSKLIWVHDF